MANTIAFACLDVRVSAVLSRLGIQTRLQLAITISVAVLIVVTTLGGSGGAPWVFFTYRTLLVVVAVLGAIGSKNADLRIDRLFLAATAFLFALMLISVLRIQGSHFEGFYLWFKYLFFACGFISLANYARYQSARWKGLLLVVVVAAGLAHLLPDLVLARGQVVGFSHNNANYFATFLLIGLGVTMGAAAFGASVPWRIAAGAAAALTLFGIMKTSSRGATVAVIAMCTVAAVRARARVPRQLWLVAALGVVLIAVISSPYLIQKFTDRGEVDPYNYARTGIWLSSLRLIAHNPVLGVGFGQFLHISKRYTLPVEGTVARYLKRAQMAHNEYLQHIGELGIPAAVLLFSLLGCLLYVVFKRAHTVWPEYRCFHEAALLTATGIAVHALVDNCWTIPVTTSGLIVLALSDPLPLVKVEQRVRHRTWQLALAGAFVAIVYILSIAAPALALYYNDLGHQAYDRNDFVTAERFHLAALGIVPNHPLFLDNLGMVYLEESTERRDPSRLESARQYFARAIDANPRALEPHIHMETVLIRLLSGDPAHDRHIYQDIVRFNTQLLEIDPFLPFACKNLASAYYNLGEMDRAIKELNKAIGYEPNYVPGYFQLADWYGERGDMQSRAQYMTAAFSIVNKYRDFKPTQAYEGMLLGRPESSWAANTGAHR
jgi:O-antigen ligase